MKLIKGQPNNMKLAECEAELQKSLKLMASATRQFRLLLLKCRETRARLDRATANHRRANRYTLVLRLHSLEGVTAMYGEYSRQKSQQVQDLTNLRAILLEEELREELDFIDFDE